MKRILILLSLLLLVSPAQADFEADLDALFSDYATLGASVAVMQNGEITHTYAYGLTHPKGGPVTPDTLFQVGSISKMVSNIGLLQLLEEEGIPLDTGLDTLFPFTLRHPRYDTPVTLRQLMTHTASLRDSGDYRMATEGQVKPLSHLFGRNASYSFYSRRVPGTVREYSNLGGGLIGSLIEQLSGQTVDAYMKEHVFAPLGITATYLPATLGEDCSLADIYRMPSGKLGKSIRADETRLDAPDPENHYWITAGRLVISAPGLCRILIALCDEGICGNTRILSEEAAREMITPQSHRGSVRCECAHGLFVNILPDDVAEGRTMVGHGGKAYGMLCAAYFDPADRTGVVMLTNGCKNHLMHGEAGRLSHEVITLVYDSLITPFHQALDPFEVLE